MFINNGRGASSCMLALTAAVPVEPTVMVSAGGHPAFQRRSLAQSNQVGRVRDGTERCSQ